MKRFVLATLAYSRQFHFPLTAREVWRRLLVYDGKSPQSGEKSAASFLQVKKTLKHLVAQNTVSEVDGWYFFVGDHGAVARRQRCLHDRRVLGQEVAHFVHLVCDLPWIESVWVTGSVAVGNATTDQDCDFMLITRPRRLWLTRVVVMYRVWRAGKKRWPNTQGNHTWCLNLWLDTNHLLLPQAKQSVYSAYEVTQAQVVFTRRGGAERFWRANSWVRQYLPNWHPTLSRQTRVTGSLRTPHRVVRYFLDIVNLLLWWLQRAYMQQHKTQEDVSLGFAFFHPRSTAGDVIRRWQSCLRQVQYRCDMGTHFSSRRPRS